MRLRAVVAVSLTLSSLVALLWSPARQALRWLRRSWEARVAVAGRSMEPALEDGDWVLVDPDAYCARRPRAAELVLAPDPRDDARVLIKRIERVERDGGV